MVHPVVLTTALLLSLAVLAFAIYCLVSMTAEGRRVDAFMRRGEPPD